MTGIKRDHKGRVMKSYDVLKGLAAVGAIAVVSACGGNAQAENPDETEAEAFVRVVNVGTEVVEPTTFVQTISLTGVVQAMQDVTVAAEESGLAPGTQLS